VILYFSVNMLVRQENVIKSGSILSQESDKTDWENEQYYEIILTILHPYVKKEIENYYDKILISPPSVPPYVMEILSIEKPDRMNTYKFLITINVRPYVSAHHNVGEDELEFIIDLKEIKLEDYRHIKDYELSPHVKHYYKNGINQVS